ncbi:DUF1016 N-terminal domain-containing protein [Arthrobacter silviterrae]|nr:DUF1016 N-terminal domain-containing protein [Arthrobacter silviterrae]
MVLRLAADLKEKFPEARGYSSRYLRYMKSFAEAWPDLQEVAKGCCNFAMRIQRHVVGEARSPQSGTLRQL